MRSLLFIATIFIVSAPATAAIPITGKWATQDGKGIVDIAPCGAKLCGTLVKLTVPYKGNPLDKDNSDPKLRSRPLIGLPLLTGLTDKGKAWEGSVYSPERGKTYRAVVARNANGTLAMKGCISFLCETQTWKPVR
jgi:uncharacterized protein (DUF2147 family)